MAEYAKFTEEMIKTHIILVPDMLPIHFKLLIAIFESKGYHMELLRNDSRAVVDEGLKNVHNDACYPALLVIGQFMDALKSGKYDAVLDEIKRIRSAARNKILKVIIETCLLTYDEKIKMCKIVSESGADYIKTSTGFSSGGATLDDIKLMKENVAPHLKIKAAGGISTLIDAENFIKAGASRLGTSRIVKIIKNGKDNSGY